MEPIASIDRVTVVGDLEGDFREDGKARGVGVEAAVAVCRSYAETSMPGKYPYRSAFALGGGGFVSFSRTDTAVPLVRVDLNPNKLAVDAPVREILRLMFDTRCTRLDVAVDYPGESVGDWVPFGRAGKHFQVNARGGAVETFMVGARSSARQLVVYDKIADAKAKGEPVPWDFSGPMTRVEARERYRPDRGVSVLAPDLMDDVSLVRRHGEYAGLSLRDRAMLHYLAEFPEAWNQLCRETRRRLGGLITVQGESTLEPSAGSIYRCSLKALHDAYFSVVGGGDCAEVV